MKKINRNNKIVLLLIIFVLHSAHCTLHVFCADQSQILWEDLAKETDLNIAIEKAKEIINNYPESPYAIDSQYIIAEYEYLKGNYAQAYREFQSLIEKFRRNKYTSLAWYRRASCLLLENRYDEAIKEFQQSIFFDPWGEHSVLAKIGIADTYFAKNDYNNALREYRAISGQLQHYALYRTALCHQNLNNKREFETSKKELIRKYPCSLEAALIERITEFNAPAEQASVSLTLQKDNKITESAITPAEVLWTIQVGSFTKEENARNLSATLIRRKYISWIQYVKVGDGFFYRVYLGKFKTEEEAKKKAEEIVLKENFPARIVELR